MRRAAALFLAVLLGVGGAPTWVWAQATGSDAGLSEGCAGRSLAATTDVNINTTVNVQLVTGVAGQLIAICHVNLVAGGIVNVALVEGTGATCGTGTAGLFGGATAATGWNFPVAGQGIVLGTGRHVIRRSVTTGDNLCLLVSAAVQISGLIRVAQF